MRIRSYLGMQGQIQVKHRWADETVRRKEEDNGRGNGTLDVRRRGQGGLISVCNNKRRILGRE